MNAVTAARIVIIVAPTLMKLSAHRSAIKAAKAERKFYEEVVVTVTTKREPIRVKCERLA